MMRVGVDVTPTISGLTGVARYASSLVTGLEQQGVAVVPFAIGRGPGRLPAGTRHLKVPLRVVQRWWQLGLPLHAERLCGPVDVVHSTDLMLPPTRRPLVATVHDAAAIEMPELHSAGAIRQTRARLESLHRAAVIIANSRATAEAIAGFVDVDDVVVVPLAPYPLPEPLDQSPIAGPFLLCVGEVTDRKDHVTLVRAFSKADLGPTRLVIAGPQGTATAQVLAEIERLALNDRVVVTGRVDDRTLATLYRSATALCLTSRQEGFGLPIVEAMQRGIPVVATDLPAVREVAGRAAVLVAAGDVIGFAAAFESVSSDADRRRRLTAAGRTQSRRFSLERTVAGTIAAYELALARC